MYSAKFIGAALAALHVAGGAIAATTATIPTALVPTGEQAVERVAARGVQIYSCRVSAVSPTGAEWLFIAPEAELFDAQGKSIGRHYAGPNWEAHDGSRIAGSVKARADAPQPGAIPWLLLSAQSTGKQGRFSRVTSVQRIDTAGGSAPTHPCSTAQLGTTAKVPYTADYVLFAPRKFDLGADVRLPLF
jgi:hypothetical protein